MKQPSESGGAKLIPPHAVKNNKQAKPIMILKIPPWPILQLPSTLPLSSKSAATLTAGLAARRAIAINPTLAEMDGGNTAKIAVVSGEGNAKAAVAMPTICKMFKAITRGGVFVRANWPVNVSVFMLFSFVVVWFGVVVSDKLTQHLTVESDSQPFRR
jgi:hypothetical protein